jgi:hypothetical protein
MRESLVREGSRSGKIGLKAKTRSEAGPRDTGLSVQEAAHALGISRATADRYWSYARTWLYCELGGKEGRSGLGKKSSGV